MAYEPKDNRQTNSSMYKKESKKGEGRKGSILVHVAREYFSLSLLHVGYELFPKCLYVQGMVGIQLANH